MTVTKQRKVTLDIPSFSALFGGFDYNEPSASSTYVRHHVAVHITAI